jgi:acetoin utilization protein AcuB
MSQEKLSPVPTTRSRVRDLTVADLMAPDPETVTPETLLRDVIQLMKLEGCRQLPVLDRRERLVGIITDRDVRLAMNSPIVLHERWQDELLVESVTAESCMTSNPMTASPDMPATRAAVILSTFKFGALPVIEQDRLVGIISVTDFLNWFADQQPEGVGPEATG